MTDPIKAALDEAAKRLCFGHNGEDCDMCVAPEHCYKAHTFLRKDAAAAIAAFLRALPISSVHFEQSVGHCGFAGDYALHASRVWTKSGQDLAAAVEEAARHE